MYIGTCTYIYIDILINLSIYLSIYLYMHTRTHIYICKYIYTRHCLFFPTHNKALTESQSMERTEWRRPIGCLKLQIIFRKRATNYRALLQEMSFKDKASYGSSPPCIQVCVRMYIYMYVYI